MRTTALHSAGDLLSDWLLPLSVVLRTFVWFGFILFALFRFAHLLLNEAVVLVAQVAHWD